MSWVRDLVEVFEKIASVEHRLTSLAKRYDALALAYDDINQRLARLEGKFELLERMASTRRRLSPSK